MANTSWQTISSTYPFENPWYKVREDKVIRPDGKPGTYNVVETSESVFIVPLTKDRRILMVKLFRYTTQRDGWEIPAGGIEGAESPEDAARRELQEETGYTGGSWQFLGKFDSMNGISNSQSNVFIAEGLHASGSSEQGEEGITGVQAFTLPEVLELIAGGEIVDSLTISALMVFLNARNLITKQL